MRRASLALALAALATSPAGCGGGSTHKTPTKFVNGHPCLKADEALQCILPPAPRGLRLEASPYPRGVDFAWGAPSVARMRALGAGFGASYLSHDRAKGWQQRPGLVSEYHRAGIATVAVWETSANRAGEGCSAGRSDALAARGQAAEVGNTASTIDFAIDFDASGSQVDGYFRCAHATLGSRTGAYGGYYPLKYLCARGLASKAWQTYAWSGGQWLPSSCAPLEQYLNDSSVDYDRAIAADYGQWPGPVSPKPKPVSRGQKYHLLHVLRRLRLQHVCARAPKHGGGRWHHPCSVWTREGKRLNREGVK
jgi:hypothetical protein